MSPTSDNPGDDDLDSSSSPELSSIPDDPRLVRVIEEYLRELEAGKSPDRHAYLERYPELAQALNECLDGLELIRRGSAPEASPPLEDLFPPPGTSPIHPVNPLGDFQIVREIGRGGMGLVYEAIQLSLGRRVALKVLPFAATFDARQLQRFRHEAQAAAQLHHTNIVPVYAVGCERGIHFYAMQLIDGQSLDAVIRQLRQQAGDQSMQRPAGSQSSVSRSRTVSSPSTLANLTEPWPAGVRDHAAPPSGLEKNPSSNETITQLSTQLSTQRSAGEHEFYRFVARAMAQAALAIEYAHQQGIVHRDLKPANLLVDSHGMIWITDFGLAHFHTDAGLTQTGDILGTVRYMSPEQASGQRVVLDHRTDIYSLGATFYELLTLQPVFAGSTRQTLLDQVLNQEPRSPRAIDRRIPVELETILLKTLSKTPGDRYASAQSLADDLSRFLRDEPILAKRPSPAEYVRKWARRHPSLVAASVVTMFVILVISLVANWEITQANNRANLALGQERLRAEEAERRFCQARQVVDLLIDVCEKDLADKPPLQGLRKRLLETSLVYYQDFITDRRDHPDSQAELIAVRERLKKILDDLSVLEGAGQLVLLADERIQTELELTTSQRQRIQAVTHDVTQRRLDSLGDFHQLSAKDRSARFLQWARTNEQAVRETLSATQLRRLEQIRFQLQGPMAFNQPEVVACLHLTETQQEAIRQIERAAFSSIGEFWHEHDKETSPNAFREKLLKTTVEQVLAVLTPEQREAWKELTGEPLISIPDIPPHIPFLQILGDGPPPPPDGHGPPPDGPRDHSSKDHRHP